MPIDDAFQSNPEKAHTRWLMLRLGLLGVLGICVGYLAFLGELAAGSNFTISATLLRPIAMTAICFGAALGPTRHTVAMSLSLVAILSLACFPDSVFLFHSKVMSLVSLMGMVLLLRLAGFRLRLASWIGSSYRWHPTLLHIVLFTTVAGLLFASQRFIGSDDGMRRWHFVWPVCVYMLLVSWGLTLLSRNHWTSKAFQLALVTLPPAIVLAEPTLVASHMSWGAVAELMIACGWCLICFGLANVIGIACVRNEPKPVPVMASVGSTVESKQHAESIRWEAAHPL